MESDLETEPRSVARILSWSGCNSVIKSPIITSSVVDTWAFWDIIFVSAYSGDLKLYNREFQHRPRSNTGQLQELSGMCWRDAFFGRSRRKKPLSCWINCLDFSSSIAHQMTGQSKAISSNLQNSSYNSLMKSIIYFHADVWLNLKSATNLNKKMRVGYFYSWWFPLDKFRPITKANSNDSMCIDLKYATHIFAATFENQKNPPICVMKWDIYRNYENQVSWYCLNSQLMNENWSRSWDKMMMSVPSWELSNVDILIKNESF